MGGVPSFQTGKQFHESMSYISSNHMFFSLYIYDLHGSVMYVKYPSFATSQSPRFFIPVKRSIHGGNYSMQSHRFYIPPSCTKTMKQKYPIISAIDDKWRWDCVAIPNLMIWLFCFIIFHEPMPPHSPTAVSDGTLPGAKPGHQIRQTKIDLRLARQAQGRCRLLTFFPIFDGGTPGCVSQQHAFPFYKRWHAMGPRRDYVFSNFVVSNTLASTSWQLGKDSAILRVCMCILVSLWWLWWGE